MFPVSTSPGAERPQHAAVSEGSPVASARGAGRQTPGTRPATCGHQPHPKIRVSIAPSTGMSTGLSIGPSPWADAPSTPEDAGQQPRTASAQRQANRSTRPIFRGPRPGRIAHPLLPAPFDPLAPRLLPRPSTSCLPRIRPAGPPPKSTADASTRADRRAPTILPLICGTAIRRQPIQTSANNHAPAPHRKQPGYSHAFSPCKDQE